MLTCHAQLTLSADCDILTGPVYVPHNLHLTVSSPTGSRRTIKGVTDNHLFVVAGKLTLSNVDLEGRLGANMYQFPLFAIRAWNAVSISLQDVIVRNETLTGQHRAGLFLVNVGSTTLTRVTIRDHNIGSTFWEASAMSIIGSSKVSVSDSTFSNNRGGAGAIRVHNSNSRANLASGNSFSDNTPINIYAHRGALSGTLPEAVTWFGVVPAPRSDDASKAVVRGGPAASTGEQLLTTGFRVWAQYGLRSGIQFQRREIGAVGIQSLIDRGVLDVVDVWGYADQDWEVCFPQSGTLVFLDAALSPRVPESVPAYHEDGYTCIAKDRAGMVVLMPGSPSPVAGRAAVGSAALKPAGPGPAKLPGEDELHPQLPRGAGRRNHHPGALRCHADGAGADGGLVQSGLSRGAGLDQRGPRDAAGRLRLGGDRTGRTGMPSPCLPAPVTPTA